MNRNINTVISSRLWRKMEKTALNNGITVSALTRLVLEGAYSTRSNIKCRAPSLKRGRYTRTVVVTLRKGTRIIIK